MEGAVYTHHVEGEGEAEQEEPYVEVQGVDKGALVGVVVPAPGDGSPHSLPKDLQRLRAHGPPCYPLRAAFTFPSEEE